MCDTSRLVLYKHTFLTFDGDISRDRWYRAYLRLCLQSGNSALEHTIEAWNRLTHDLAGLSSCGLKLKLRNSRYEDQTLGLVSYLRDSIKTTLGTKRQKPTVDESGESDRKQEDIRDSESSTRSWQSETPDEVRKRNLGELVKILEMVPPPKGKLWHGTESDSEDDDDASPADKKAEDLEEECLWLRQKTRWVVLGMFPELEPHLRSISPPDHDIFTLLGKIGSQLRRVPGCMKACCKPDDDLP